MYQNMLLSVDKTTTASVRFKLHALSSGPILRCWIEWRDETTGSTVTVSMSERDAKQLREQLDEALKEETGVEIRSLLDADSAFLNRLTAYRAEKAAAAAESADEDPLLKDPVSWHLRAAKTEEA
jgi:hypothetical protein